MKIEEIKMDKKMILYIIAAIIVSGLMGFYGGRYYEGLATKKNMVIRQGTRPNSRQNFDQTYERMSPPLEETPPSTN